VKLKVVVELIAVGEEGVAAYRRRQMMQIRGSKREAEGAA